MRRRVIEVEFDDVGSLVRGYGSRELVAEVTGRRPLWRTLAHGWSVQEHTARDVVALAEERGYDIVVLGPAARHEVSRFGTGVADAPPAATPKREGLW